MDSEHKWFVVLQIFICSPLLVKGLSSEDLQNCPPKQYGKIGNSAIVQCDVKQSSDQFYWWDESSDDPIVRYENGAISGRGYDSEEYNLTNDGSLIINEVNFTGNRNYTIRALDESSELIEMAIITFSTEGPAPTNRSMVSTDSMTTTLKPDDVDGGFPIWAIILIIVAALIIICLIVAVVIKNVRKKDKAKREKIAAGGSALE